MCRSRKHLYRIGICYRKCLPAPFIGKLDIVLDISYTVHIAHLGMKIKLYSLLALVCIHTLSLGALHLLDIPDTVYRQLRSPLIRGGNISAQNDVLSVLKLVLYIIFGVFITIKLTGYGIASVRKIEFDYVFFVSGLNGLRCEYLTLDDHISHAFLKT